MRAAKAEGRICAAYLCENTSEPLFNLGNCFGVRLFAPNTGSMDVATYYMSNLLCETYGIDVSDAAIRKAVTEHNRVCRVIKAMGEFRKEERPRITGYEFAVLTLATYVCPKDSSGPGYRHS